MVTCLPPIVVLARATFGSACLATFSTSTWIAEDETPLNCAAMIWSLPSWSAPPAMQVEGTVVPRSPIIRVRLYSGLDPTWYATRALAPVV